MTSWCSAAVKVAGVTVTVSATVRHSEFMPGLFKIREILLLIEINPGAVGR